MFPELALTTFFPRYDLSGDRRSTPATRPRCRASTPSRCSTRRPASRSGSRSATPSSRPTGTATTRWSSSSGTDRPSPRFHKVHIPGHEEPEGWRRFQHLERRYFEPGPEGFAVHDAFGGRIGMAICNDRRWPETYRVMGLQGVELVLIGYNTPLHYAPDPNQDRLAGVPQQPGDGGRRLPERHVGGRRGQGRRRGRRGPAARVPDHRPDRRGGRPLHDERATRWSSRSCDLDRCAEIRETVFDFGRYRRPEVYGPITEPG